MRSTFMLFVATCLLVAACSSNETPPPAPPEPQPGITYDLAYQTPGGEQIYWCEFVQIPFEPGTVYATGFEWDTANLHHLSLFRTTGLSASDVTGTPFKCFGSPETSAAAPASVFSHETAPNITPSLYYPEGYAIPFEPGEILMVQAHTLNTSTRGPIDATCTLRMLTASAGAEIIPLGEIQLYDPFIVVPPHSEGRASMRSTIPRDIDVVYMLTHQHSSGVGFTAYLDPPGGPESTTPFLSSPSWDQPASVLGVQHIAAGSTFRVYCDYQNDTDAPIYQGPNLGTHEMCQLYGAYATPVNDPAEVFWEVGVPRMFEGGTGDMHGTGAATCTATLACLAACTPDDFPAIKDGLLTVGACWQECIVDSCPSASGPVYDVYKCALAACQNDCAAGTGEPACQACVIGECSAEVTACQNTVCE